MSMFVPKRSLVRTLLLAATLLLASTGYAAALDPVWSNWRGLAVAGYDPVAYFTDGKAVEGSSDFTAEWKGATWRFASAAHRDQFKAEPEKYAPQYGGYCAYGMTVGQKVPVDPAAWSIVEGRLYLNNSLKVREAWSQDPAGNIGKADAAWPKVRDQ